MSRYARAAGALGHLLLVVVLALGVFVMHTMGHPSEAHGSGSGQASHAAVAVPQPASAHEQPASAHEQPASAHEQEASAHEQPAAHQQEASARERPASAAGDAPHPVAAGHSASTDPPLGAGDMTSLCVAVLLAVWVLTALVRSALAREPGRLTRLHARALAAMRPDPPPPRGPDLTLLSVLRL
ncbi:hypothetical protein AB0N88_14205 [Streptomyces sp. NPDC093516]|uniref:hypothetical protein n=1 Tax=Streptomyces sp. NPDC093516 TaxID=3155304 RepID=UPI00342A5885